ncbi:MAG: selenophosphate synthase [Syntrophomonadaceae bacterium]|nr:selenophosphate synthase [Syntrophomonadaceae bacterium]
MANLAIRRIRDLVLIELGLGNCLVIACDSSGAIGPKKGDVIQVPGYLVGRLITRVALMEVMAAGARPVSIVDTLSVEMHPTGAAILRGVFDEAMAAGLNPEQVVTGSTEENIPTHQTAMGLTVIGLAGPGELRLGNALAGDLLICVGLPKVGHEVTLDDPMTMDLKILKTLLAVPGVNELLPIGSKGIAYEAGQLAETAGLTINWHKTETLDLTKSAGPATCLIAAVQPFALKQVLSGITIPVHNLGVLMRPS